MNIFAYVENEDTFWCRPDFDHALLYNFSMYVPHQNRQEGFGWDKTQKRYVFPLSVFEDVLNAFALTYADKGEIHLVRFKTWDDWLRNFGTPEEKRAL